MQKVLTPTEKGQGRVSGTERAGLGIDFVRGTNEGSEVMCEIRVRVAGE